MCLKFHKSWIKCINLLCVIDAVGAFALTNMQKEAYINLKPSLGLYMNLCDFGASRDENICDQIVIGILDKRTLKIEPVRILLRDDTQPDTVYTACTSPYATKSQRGASEEERERHHGEVDTSDRLVHKVPVLKSSGEACLCGYQEAQ